MVVVITGSTRGIGFGLARAFLERGCSVVVSGRTTEAVARSIERLGGGDRLAGRACDVSDAGQVQALWDEAVRAFGRVDHWINNAGTCNRLRPFVELSPEEIAEVVQANVLGTMNGSHVALLGMA